MAQEAVRVGQAEVQEAVVLAWEAPVSGKRAQTVEVPAAEKWRMCRQRGSPPYAASATAFLLPSHQTRRHRPPLKTPPLPVLPQGFPDLPFEASWLEEVSAPSCSSSSSLIFQAYQQIGHSDLTSSPQGCLAHRRRGAQTHPPHSLHQICRCHCHQYCPRACPDPCPQGSHRLRWYWTRLHHDLVELVLDYTSCLHLVYEVEDLEQNPLYGHTSAEPEGEVGQVEGPVVFCQGANEEHHVRGAEG